jgi:uncharacterized protein (TIGR02594 family)
VSAEQQEEGVDKELFAIQQELKKRGHEPGPTDGIWGAETRRAIAELLGIKRAREVPSGAGAAPWYDLALAEVGVKEVAGAGNSAAILGYFDDSQNAGVNQDSVAWCAAFVGAMLTRAGYKPSGSLMARSYLSWGSPITTPRTGCIVVMKRGAPPAGHVGFAVEWNAASIKVLGGNQSNAVTVQSFARAGVLGYRWPDAAL